MSSDKKTDPDCIEKCENFRDDSTCSAILYMFQDKYNKYVKAFWIVVVLLSAGGFVALTIYDIVKLSKEPISTSITLTRESELNFPAVTICSLSIFNTDTLNSVIGGTNVSDRFIELFDEVQVKKDIPKCESIARGLVRDTKRDVNYGELTNLTKHNLANLLQDCRYVGSKCNASNFEEIPTLGGVCFTYNADNSVKAKGTGVRQGLRLQLKNGNQLFSLGKDHGYRVIIHDPDEPPRPEAEGISVPLNKAVYIGLREVKSEVKTRFSGEHHRCKKGSFDGDLSIQSFTSYSPSLCENVCFYKHLADKCNCVEQVLYSANHYPYNNLPECNLIDLCCEVDGFEEVLQSCDCPPRCSTVDHTTRVSYSDNNYAENHVAINVYYETLVTESRETTDSYTVWSLISDIGGNTGLFLGFTLLTVVEFFIFLCSLIRDWCKGKCSK